MDGDRLGLLQDLQGRTFLFERQFLSEVLSRFVHSTDSAVGYLHLYKEDTQELDLTVWSEQTIADCTTVHDNHYPLAEAGNWADCIRNRAVVVHETVPFDLPEGHFQLTRHMSGCLKDESGRIIGVIGVGNRPVPYDGGTIRRFESHLREASDALLTLRRQEQITPTEALPFASDTVVLSIARTIDMMMHDRPLEAQQSWVVVTIAFGICDELGIEGQERFMIGLAAAYHDVGFQALEETLMSEFGLGQTARLALHRQHVPLGVEFVRKTGMPDTVQTAVQDHHERLDGSGYPQGLTGNDIALPARIIGLADDFEAAMNEEIGHGAGNFRQIIRNLHEARGVRYDAYVVDALWRFLTSSKGEPVRRFYGFSETVLEQTSVGAAT